SICKRLVGKIKGDVEINYIGLINKQLGVNCCVLMGANIGDEIAMEKFSEATIGYREDREVAQRWVQIFGTPYFRVSAVRDVEGVNLCGTLKDVVAIAAGFVDGLEMGNNAKAAIMRIGLNEMKAFSKLMFPCVCDNTFLESLGSRNRKVSDAFARSGGKRSFHELETELLQGQKLQVHIVNPKDISRNIYIIKLSIWVP
ncbi:hypothetical protein MKW92_018709, partial [Papaver armeniacum]